MYLTRPSLAICKTWNYNGSHIFTFCPQISFQQLCEKRGKKINVANFIDCRVSQTCEKAASILNLYGFYFFFWHSLLKLHLMAAICHGISGCLAQQILGDLRHICRLNACKCDFVRWCRSRFNESRQFPRAPHVFCSQLLFLRAECV